jgi:UDP-N-acetylmuramyl pentapeptide synthase
MEIDLKILKDVWTDAKFLNFEENIKFDHINIAKNPSREILAETHHLFFALSDPHPEKDGWYSEPVLRREHFPKITFDKPHWSFVITDEIELSTLKADSRIIIVKSIETAAKKLLSYVLSVVKPKVCAVTGSVGKTTCVAFIEQLLSIKYKTFRVYAKRISPPILCTELINNLERDTEYVVLEMAMYYKNHVEILTRMLEPTIGVILNIKAVHIGVNNILSIEDIFDSKSKIVEKAQPIVNIDDELLAKLKNLTNAISFAIYDQTAKVHIAHLDTENNIATIVVNQSVILLKPFLLTKLTLYQILATISVGLAANLEIEKIKNKITEILPKEKRMVKLKYLDYHILFDGERTLDARLNELSENFYSDSTLIVYRFEDGYPLSLDNFPTIFAKFTRTHILDKFTNRYQLGSLGLPTNTRFLALGELLQNIPYDSFVFVHYSSYYRDNELKDLSPLHLFLKT